MNRTFRMLLAFCIAAMMAPATFANDVEVRLETGATWRGDLNDRVDVTYLDQGVEVTFTGELTKVARLYIIVDGNIAGEIRSQTIFRADIVSMKDAKAMDASERSVTRRAEEGRKKSRQELLDVGPQDTDGNSLGVFFLPLEGGVGQTLRHNEILMIGEHADSFGPGQTIILKIKSNGGLVVEALDIENAIEEVKKRHRVVAWIEKAISAGCSTAMSCDEIYFMTEGSAGSVTTLAGSGSLTGAEAERHVDDFVRLAKKNGYSEHIARSMKLNKYMCSYDKDPETGEVTFYGDESGEFVLSRADQNLSFNANNALHCGFSKGTADTLEELASALGYPKYHEIDDYGRKVASDWQSTYKRAEQEIPILMARLNYEGAGSGDTVEVDLGDGKCEQRVGGEIKVNVMMIGGRIEKAVVAEVEKSWTRTAEACRTWLAKHGA